MIVTNVLINDIMPGPILPFHTQKAPPEPIAAMRYVIAHARAAAVDLITCAASATAMNSATPATPTAASV
jgi:hypothetical protein